MCMEAVTVHLIMDVICILYIILCMQTVIICSDHLITSPKIAYDEECFKAVLPSEP